MSTGVCNAVLMIEKFHDTGDHAADITMSAGDSHAYFHDHNRWSLGSDLSECRSWRGSTTV